MSTQLAENAYKYYQYQKGQELPVFVRCENEQAAELDGALTRLRFSEVSEDDYQIIAKRNPLTRLLTIEEASTNVAKQITYAAASDRYGLESIVPKDGYRVYRHKGVALAVYAFTAREWTLGCLSHFGSDEREFRITMNRFLSWALAPLGIVGFWGVPVEEGIVVMNQKDSEGEAIFIDVRGRRTFTVDGSGKMKARFRVIRLDSTLHQRNVSMNQTEVMAFLSAATSFIDSQGLTVGVRQMIQGLSREVEGLVHPRESFKPRTDLSL